MAMQTMCFCGTGLNAWMGENGKRKSFLKIKSGIFEQFPLSGVETIETALLTYFANILTNSHQIGLFLFVCLKKKSCERESILRTQVLVIQNKASRSFKKLFYFCVVFLIFKNRFIFRTYLLFLFFIIN